MGPGTIVDAARAAHAGAALHAWGDEVARAVDAVGPLAASGRTPPSLADGLARLRPVPSDLVHTIGWELRHAFVWRNDDRCIQRAAMGALSLAQREAGDDLTRAMGSLAREDALTSAMTVTYRPTGVGNARFHAATIARTTDDELLVIDHLVADADDGVLRFDDWLRRVGGRADDATVLSPLRMPPWSLGTHSGIPAAAAADDGEDLRAFASHLATSWDEVASRGQGAIEPLPRRQDI
ncbi:MAG: hypothetical protein JWM86_552 [Thermoleophilia bacterium]|nr:hypothetical protein [Thermoleophilia bacterium]